MSTVYQQIPFYYELLLTSISLAPVALMTLRMTSGGQEDPATIPDRHKTENHSRILMEV